MAARDGHSWLLRFSVTLEATPAQPLTEEGLHAVLSAAVTQLWGLVGGAFPFAVERGDASEGAFEVAVDRRDAQKLQAAAVFVSQYQGVPARLQLRR